MSEYDSFPAPLAFVPAASGAQEQVSVHVAITKRPRGKIPRIAWGYVLGLYDQAHETLKSIGDRFGVEPSAVHYVLKQARLQNLEPSLEAPSAGALADASSRRAAVLPRTERLPRLVPAAPPPPLAPMVNEAVEEVSRSPLVRRVFDSSAAVLNAILAFERDSSRENSQKLDEARKACSRALAAVEIWAHQMSVLQPRPALVSSEGSSAVAPADPRLVEVA